MIILTLNQDWSVAKARLQEAFTELRDEDLAYQRGREEELIDRIQRRVGLPREQIECRVHEIFGNA